MPVAFKSEYKECKRFIVTGRINCLMNKNVATETVNLRSTPGWLKPKIIEFGIHETARARSQNF